jgi:hypothetical protein
VAHDPSTFKKAAVLTGLTVLIGGAEISNANAATISDPTQTFDISIGSAGGGSPSSTTDNLMFVGFNASLGTLTQVEVQLNSTISSDVGTHTSPASLDASVTLAGQPIGSPFTTTTPVTSGAAYNEDVLFTTSLSSFEASSITAALALSTSDGFATWVGSGNPAGLTVTYTYTPTSATPLPATLPLFAGGLAALGFTTWRSRRKLTSKE